MKIRGGNGYYVNRHSCFLLQYHLVLVTKYRRPAITGGRRERAEGVRSTLLWGEGLCVT